MLKRQDLAKQFEKIVLQEITNHNDAVLATNVKVNEFRKDLVTQQKKIDSNHALTLSHVTRLDGQLEKMSTSLTTLLREALNTVNDLSLELRTHIQKSNDWMGMVEGAFLKKDIFKEYQDQEILEKFNLNQLIASLQKEFVRQEETLRWYVTTEVIKAIEEHEKKPSPLEETVATFDNKLKAHVVNVSGVQRQIDINHKQCFILEKKIENLYTLLDRLKKKISSGGEMCPKPD